MCSRTAARTAKAFLSEAAERLDVQAAQVDGGSEFMRHSWRSDFEGECEARGLPLLVLLRTLLMHPSCRTVYRRRGGEPRKRLHAMFCSETHHLGELDGGAHAWLPSAAARNWGTMLLSPWISAMTLSISSMNSCADTVL